jgi:hypothetical protein
VRSITDTLTDTSTGHLLQRSFANAWGGWVDRGLAPGGHRVSSPGAVSWGSGRIDVVARDEVTNDLVHWWQSGSTWSGPQTLAAGRGGAFVPSIASWAAHRLDVFALASAGKVLGHWWFDGAWHGPENLGTGPDRIALGGLGVTSWDSARLDVFSIDTTQHGLIQDYFNGHWTVMADPNPRSKPIPVDEKAKAAD